MNKPVPTVDELLAKIDSLEATVLKQMEDLKGPEGFASWKDAAIHERALRVKERNTGVFNENVFQDSFKHPMGEDRSKWTVGEWARHYGAYETDKHTVCFGSWFAFSNLMQGLTRSILAQKEKSDTVVH